MIRISSPIQPIFQHRMSFRFLWPPPLLSSTPTSTLHFLIYNCKPCPIHPSVNNIFFFNQFEQGKWKREGVVWVWLVYFVLKTIRGNLDTDKCCETVSVVESGRYHYSRMMVIETVWNGEEVDKGQMKERVKQNVKQRRVRINSKEGVKDMKKWVWETRPYHILVAWSGRYELANEWEWMGWNERRSVNCLKLLGLSLHAIF